MPVDVTLIVTDVPPLITLAAAGRLDYLLYPGFPVIIPDAVFHEATRQTDRLGAQEILDWYRAHDTMVRVELTEVFKNEIIRLTTQGGRLERNLGERAAVEVIRDWKLEEGQRIQSADAVLRAARDAGRHPPTRGLWDHHAPAIQDAVRTVIARAHGTDELP